MAKVNKKRINILNQTKPTLQSTWNLNIYLTNRTLKGNLLSTGDTEEADRLQYAGGSTGCSLSVTLAANTQYTASVYVNLGVCYVYTGDFIHALEYFERVKDIDILHYGERSSEVADDCMLIM